MKNKLYTIKNKTNRTLKKLITTLFIVMLMSSYPGMGYSKTNSDTKVRLSIELSQVSIKEVLSTIESKSDYVFFYSDEISSELNKRVSIDVKSKTINDILANLLKDTNLSFKFNENQVAIVRKQSTSAANSIRINGSVKDKDKNPLPGVNITIKGTSVGTASDINGNFFFRGSR